MSENFPAHKLRSLGLAQMTHIFSDIFTGEANRHGVPRALSRDVHHYYLVPVYSRSYE